MTLSSSQSPKLPRKRPQKIHQGSIRAFNSSQTNSATSQVIPLGIAHSKATEPQPEMLRFPQQHEGEQEGKYEDRSPEKLNNNQQVPKDAQVSLHRLEMIRKGLTVIIGVLGIGLIGIHGHQQKLNKDWNERRNDLEKLHKNKRELTAIIATLDYQASEEVSRNAQGYQPETLDHVIILPQLPMVSSASKSTSKPRPELPPIASKTPSWVTDPNKSPLAY